LADIVRNMRLTELTRDEQHLLGGLVRLVIRSDGRFTEAEEQLVDSLGEEMGDGRGAIWKLISASSQRYPMDDEVREALPEVTRPEARKVLLRVMERVAASDGVSAPEQALLDAVRSAWS